MVRLSDAHILPRGLGRGLGVDSVDTYNQATVERFSLVLGSYESYPEHDSFVFDVKRNSFDLV